MEGASGDENGGMGKDEGTIRERLKAAKTGFNTSSSFRAGLIDLITLVLLPHTNASSPFLQDLVFFLSLLTGLSTSSSPFLHDLVLLPLPSYTT